MPSRPAWDQRPSEGGGTRLAFSLQPAVNGLISDQRPCGFPSFQPSCSESRWNISGFSAGARDTGGRWDMLGLVVGVDTPGGLGTWGGWDTRGGLGHAGELGTRRRPPLLTFSASRLRVHVS